MIWLNSITDSMSMNLNKLWEIVEDRQGWQAMGSLRVRYGLATEQQQSEST